MSSAKPSSFAEENEPLISGRSCTGGINEGANHEVDQEWGCCTYLLVFLSYLIVICTFPFSLAYTLRMVQEHERAVIFRLGLLLPGDAKGPGLIFILPCIDNYVKVNLRTNSFDLPPQEILTKDSVTVSVDAVVCYRVFNPTVSITNVVDARKSTKFLAATTLKNCLGMKTLAEVLSDGESVSTHMQTVLDEATDTWGVKIERFEMKEVRLPLKLQRAMAAEAKAAREARAKVIAAEGEHNSARALKEAADVMSEAPVALQLRCFQTLNMISAEKNSTIILTLPLNLIESFSGFTKK